MNKEDFPADRGEDLGEYLGIKPGIISALKQKSGGVPDRLLSGVITEWLNNDKEKSWQKLSTALRYCGYSLIAEKIDPQEGIHKGKEGGVQALWGKGEGDNCPPLSFQIVMCLNIHSNVFVAEVIYYSIFSGLSF